MQNESRNQITVLTPEHAYQITAWRAVAIIASAVLVSVVGTAFAFFNTANSDHFQLIRHADRLDAIEESTVRQDVLIQQLEPMKADLAEMKADIKVLIRESGRNEN